MPLYEIERTGGLVPFRRLPGGPELYESEIERLCWANPEEFLGESLLLVARQPTLPNGGRPDIVALADDARVVVIEIKRDIDRNQLAQCLEYAGWARRTNLDELSAMYHRGQGEFFDDWVAFTEKAHPPVINPNPRLVLIARGFQGRTESAIGFLIENGLPVRLVHVSLYEDEQGRRFLDVEGEHEHEFTGPREATEPTLDHTKIDGRRITVADLVEADLLTVGDHLVWERPGLGARYEAIVRSNSSLELPDGRRFSTPSGLGKAAAEIPAIDGWHVWRVPRLDNVKLDDLRRELVRRTVAGDQSTT